MVSRRCDQVYVKSDKRFGGIQSGFCEKEHEAFFSGFRGNFTTLQVVKIKLGGWGSSPRCGVSNANNILGETRRKTDS